MISAYSGHHIEFHILQNFPVTCLNRDDTNTPKTAIIGGVTRARVSSQAWKRPVRMLLPQYGVRLGVRTRQVAGYLVEQCLALGASEKEAAACGKVMAEAVMSKDTLFYFSMEEARTFAAYAKKQNFDAKKLLAKDLAKIVKKVINTAMDGFDIALFGRMVAKQSEMNITGAASFAHAISTHKITNDIDFFTALDDFQKDQQSAYMGTLEFNSATYYRYISLDLGQLAQNIPVEDMQTAVELFTKALYQAVPIARQNTLSGAGAWDYARVYVRKGQRLQASFDEPVEAKNSGWFKPSIVALESFLAKKEQQAGSLFGKKLELTLGPDSPVSIDDIIVALKQSIGAIV